MSKDVSNPNSNAGRTGVILAAGLGSRLATEGELTSTKPLQALFGVPLLIRTLRSLEIAGCARVVIVLGHEADQVRRRILLAYTGPLQLEFTVNPDYRLKTGISVLCARPFVQDEFVLSMADHVFEDSIMELVRGHHPEPGGATLCVDYKIDAVFDLDDVTKVVEQDGVLQQIGKQLTSYNCVDTGVFICTPALMDAIAVVYEQQGDASLSDGVQALAARGAMRVLDIGAGQWQDVDTPEMLEHAEKMLASQRPEA